MEGKTTTKKKSSFFKAKGIQVQTLENQNIIRTNCVGTSQSVIGHNFGRF